MSSGFQQQVPTRGVFVRSVPEAPNNTKTDDRAPSPNEKQDRSWAPRRPHY